MASVAHRIKRLFLAALIGVTIGSVAAPILVTESALHILERPRPEPGEANAVAGSTASAWEPVRVTAADGVVLDGWLFTPRRPNGSAVILLHGVGDSRAGVLAHAGYLLRAGFTVLTPDSRGHGSSGGSLITYGIREASDVHIWAGWLFQDCAIQRLYGLGESMGAAILLESLPGEPRFKAVVAEAPFSTFGDIAYYRLERAAGLPAWAARPVVQIGFLYTRLVHGVDLRQASPAAAVRTTRVPILLIHGTRDVNIPLGQSVALHALNPTVTTLWIVPGARHVSALGAAPEQYLRNVIQWFDSHP
jgi:dipeptidyl aminopeptidase/acylaminoacyl peptidase